MHLVNVDRSTIVISRKQHIMSAPTYLVTGATGKTGSAVVAQLRAGNHAVRAVVRRRDARSAALEKIGAETIVADLFDPDQLLEAMRGTTRAYYCPPWHPHMLQSATAFAVAAREAKLEAIVGLTQWLASPAHPSLLTRQHWLADNIFAVLPEIAHVAIAPGFFADSYLMPDVLQYAAQLGFLPWPFGDGTNAPPSNEDIARVAVGALLDPQRHAGRAYRPTGPDLLSGADMAAILSRVFERDVRLLPMPMWMFLRAMRVSGWGRFEQLSAREYVREVRRGTFAVNAPTNHVLDVTGRQPETFETTARRYAALPSLQQNAANRLRTLTEFTRIGLTPNHDLEAFERRSQHPIPPHARLAIDDERWLIERDPEWSRLPAVQRLDLRGVGEENYDARPLRELVAR
jgi:uncharacterized protein YbjT (DUF2867 family)